MGAKKFDLNKISNKYHIRKLSTSDINEIFSLMRNNPHYFNLCPPSPTFETIRNDFSDLPNNKTYSDKYYVGYFLNNKLIAILDFIDHYPYEDSGFIGFLWLIKIFKINILEQK